MKIYIYIFLVTLRSTHRKTDFILPSQGAQSIPHIIYRVRQDCPSTDENKPKIL